MLQYVKHCNLWLPPFLAEFLSFYTPRCATRSSSILLASSFRFMLLAMSRYNVIEYADGRGKRAQSSADAAAVMTLFLSFCPRFCPIAVTDDQPRRPVFADDRELGPTTNHGEHNVVVVLLPKVGLSMACCTQHTSKIHIVHNIVTLTDMLLVGSR